MPVRAIDVMASTSTSRDDIITIDCDDQLLTFRYCGSVVKDKLKHTGPLLMIRLMLAEMFLGQLYSLLSTLSLVAPAPLEIMHNLHWF
jgi:hypothetical protein